MLRTRSPRAGILYCYRKLRVRLACVKHAASVRSEPGSNSHLKLVSCEAIHRWRIAPFTICRFVRTNLLNRSVFTQSLRALTANTGQTKRVLARLIRLSKSWILPGLQEGVQTSGHSTERKSKSQAKRKIAKSFASVWPETTVTEHPGIAKIE